MWTNNDVTRRLRLQVPIVQGPFGGGLSAVELVAAVSNGGGLGSFGVHHLDGAGIRAVAAAIRTRTDRPFALNLWVPLGDSDDPAIDAAQWDRHVARMQPYYDELGVDMPARPQRFWPRWDEQIDAVLDARPAAFSFVFGVPDAHVVERCRERGIVTIGTATTVAEAVALDAAGIDLIVATGFEAGGHRVSFLQSAEASLTGTFALVPQVVDAVRAPVIAAGGIADARGVAAALTLGAQAVQIGTAFLACEQSGAHPLHRAALFTPAARDTALTRAFSGRLARGLRNRLLTELQPHVDDLPGYPVQTWFTGPLKAAALAQGRTDLVALWAGQSAALLREHDAAVLLRRLVDGTSAVLGARTAAPAG